MGGLDRLWNPCQKRRWRPKVRGSGQEGIENFARKGEPRGIPGLGQDALGSSIEPLVFGALLGWAALAALSSSGSTQGPSIPHSSSCPSPKDSLLQKAFLVLLANWLISGSC